VQEYVREETGRDVDGDGFVDLAAERDMIFAGNWTINDWGTS